MRISEVFFKRNWRRLCHMHDFYFEKPSLRLRVVSRLIIRSHSSLKSQFARKESSSEAMQSNELFFKRNWWQLFHFTNAPFLICCEQDAQDHLKVFRCALQCQTLLLRVNTHSSRLILGMKNWSFPQNSMHFFAKIHLGDLESYIPDSANHHYLSKNVLQRNMLRKLNLADKFWLRILWFAVCKLRIFWFAARKMRKII